MTNQETLKALDRALARLERKQGRGPRRFPKSAITLVLGLLVGRQLLTRLVPLVWGASRTEGLWVGTGPFGRAIALGSEFCQVHGSTVDWGIAGVGLVVIVLGFGSRLVRALAWVAAALVLLLDGAIVLYTFQASVAVAGNGL